MCGSLVGGLVGLYLVWTTFKKPGLDHPDLGELHLLNLAPLLLMGGAVGVMVGGIAGWLAVVLVRFAFAPHIATDSHQHQNSRRVGVGLLVLWLAAAVSLVVGLIITFSPVASLIYQSGMWDRENAKAKSRVDEIRKLPPDQAVEALRKLLRDEVPAHLKTDATVALADYGSRAAPAVPELVDYVGGSAGTLVGGSSSTAAALLLELGPAAVAAVPTLIDWLESPRPTDHRRFAARLLLQIGPAAREAVPTLSRVVEQDADSDVSEWAYYALLKIDQRAAADTAFVNSPHPVTRAHALSEIARQTPAVAVELAKRLVNDPEPDVRSRALHVLREVSATEAVATAQNLLGDRDLFVQALALEIMLDSGPNQVDQATIDGIVQALNWELSRDYGSPDRIIRALYRLHALAPQDAVERAHALMQSPNMNTNTYLQDRVRQFLAEKEKPLDSKNETP
ncbi:MAG: HEAT repeat domain-containing protein [Pirellulaceae bacterium]